MSERDKWLKEVAEKMEKEGYEPVTGVAGEIPIADITHGEPMLGLPPTNKMFFDVDGEAIERICSQVWEKLCSQVQSIDDVQQIMRECCIQGYALGYLQGRHEGLRMLKEEAEKPESEEG